MHRCSQHKVEVKEMTALARSRTRNGVYSPAGKQGEALGGGGGEGLIQAHLPGRADLGAKLRWPNAKSSILSPETLWLYIVHDTTS